MALKIWINGELFDKENAKISVFDHGLLYGDGVFEGLRSYSGNVFKLDEHLDRFYESAASILLNVPMEKSDLADAVKLTLSENGIVDGYVRLIITRGTGTLGLDPGTCSNPQIIIIADMIKLYPQEFYDNGLEIITASTIRNHPNALNSRVKSLNYLNNIMGKVEGTQAGCVEALMLNHNGDVAECTADNIFLVKNGIISTPSIDAGILAGITRDTVIDIAKESGYAVSECTLSRHDVYVADECFLTGTAAEIAPIVKVDQRVIGSGAPGVVTKELHEKFHALVRS